MFAVADACLYCTSNHEVYCTKQQKGPYFIDNKPCGVVRRMVQPMYGSGCNIINDN